MNIEILRGEMITKIEGMSEGSDVVTFHTAMGRKFQLFHDQDCCESVNIVEVIGNPADLLDSFLTMADEVSSDDFPAPDGYCESYSWTFYKFATIKGYVDLRWLGTSNGYYSESVSFTEIK